MTLVKSFVAGYKHVSRKKVIKHDKKLREKLDDDKLDEMLACSMDASDPVCHY